MAFCVGGMEIVIEILRRSAVVVSVASAEVTNCYLHTLRIPSYVKHGKVSLCLKPHWYGVRARTRVRAARMHLNLNYRIVRTCLYYYIVVERILKY